MSVTPTSEQAEKLAADSEAKTGDWDAVVLVSYPNRKAFMDMVADPAYQKGHDDRMGGVERMALVAMSPGRDSPARTADVPRNHANPGR